MRPRALVLVLGLVVACSKAESDDVEVEVRSVGVDSLSNSPVVVLQDKAHHTALPIWIGVLEAQAIAMQIEGVNPPRPMTHDLMKELLVQSGVELERVVISDMKDRTYFAAIHLRAGGKGVSVDGRPSDAIALAVRFKKPIFVAKTLLSGDAAIDIEKVFGADTIQSRGVTVQALSADLADVFQVEAQTGVLVSRVAAAVPAIQPGDVIVAVNEEEVRDPGQFAEKMQRLGSATARLRVQRGGARFEVALPPADDAG
jgi:uncharacterized protein